MNVTVKWRPIWYSRYLRGKIIVASLDTPQIEQIYKRKSTGQIRLYSDHDFDGKDLSVNGDTFITMRARGRFGRLYIQE